jgi:hypothetical protein
MSVFDTNAAPSYLGEWLVPPGVELSPSISAFGPVDNSTPEFDLLNITYSALTNNLPVEQGGYSVYSKIQPSFLQDYYYRIHVSPSLVDLGNLTSAVSQAVEVWNSFFLSETLYSISANGQASGVELDSGSTPPTLFKSLQSRSYTLTASLDGSPAIQADFAFNFSTQSPVLSVLGQRISVWPYMAQVAWSEVLEFKTNIISCYGKEQRIALRTNPRVTLKYVYQLSEREFSKSKALTNSSAHRALGVPDWFQGAEIGALALGAVEVLFNTSELDFRAGESVIIWDSHNSYEAIQITDVLSDRVLLRLPTTQVFTRAMIAPLKVAMAKNGFQFQRSSYPVIETTATFTVTKNSDLSFALPFPVYRSAVVFNQPSILQGSLAESMERPVEVFDNGTSVPLNQVLDAWVRYRSVLSFSAISRTEYNTMRSFIHSRNGKQKSFWVPSFNNDLTLTTDIGVGATAIFVQTVNYEQNYGITDILIELKNGGTVYARVLSGVSSGIVDTLGLDASMATAIQISDVARIMFLNLVRFDSDSVEIKHTYAGNATANIPIVWVPE